MEYFDGGIIRVFDDQSAYGDPYLYTMTFKLCEEDPGMIEIVGVTKPPTTSQLRAIVTELRSRKLQVLRLRRDGAHPGVKFYR